MWLELWNKGMHIKDLQCNYLLLIYIWSTDSPRQVNIPRPKLTEEELNKALFILNNLSQLEADVWTIL